MQALVCWCYSINTSSRLLRRIKARLFVYLTATLILHLISQPGQNCRQNCSRELSKLVNRKGAWSESTGKNDSDRRFRQRKTPSWVVLNVVVFFRFSLCVFSPPRYLFFQTRKRDVSVYLNPQAYFKFFWFFWHNLSLLLLFTYPLCFLHNIPTAYRINTLGTAQVKVCSYRSMKSGWNIGTPKQHYLICISSVICLIARRLVS